MNLRDTLHKILEERDASGGRTRLEVMLRAVVDAAEKGEPWAVAYVSDRAFGKAAQTSVFEAP